MTDVTTEKQDRMFVRIVEKARDTVSPASDIATPDVGVGRDVSRNLPDVFV
jgi:uncharacterized protein with NRDE domain